MERTNRKGSIFALGTKILASLVLLLGNQVMTGCSDDDKPTPATDPEWTMSLPVEFEGLQKAAGDPSRIVTYFGPEDRVYVFNVTKKKLLGGCLKPQTAGAGKSVLVSDGKLRGKVEAGDMLKLYYLPQNWNAELMKEKIYSWGGNPWQPLLDPRTMERNPFPCMQTGLPYDLNHFNLAEGSVKVWTTTNGTILTTTEQTELRLTQSFFSFRFRFLDHKGQEVDASEFGVSEKNPDGVGIWLYDQELFSYKPASIGDLQHLAIHTWITYTNIGDKLFGNLRFDTYKKSGEYYSGFIEVKPEYLEDGRLFILEEPVDMKELAYIGN